MRLFKYGSFNWKYDESTGSYKSNLLRSVSGGYVYCSDFSSLNDPFELKTCFKFSLPVNDYDLKIKKDLLRRWLKVAKRKLAEDGESEGFMFDLRSKDIKHMERGKFLWVVDKLGESLVDSLERSTKKSRVACFSRSEDEQLMWGHYADGMRGVCLEFDIPDDFKDVSFFDVLYKEDVKTVDLWDYVAGNIEFIVESHRRKPKCWCYEKEVRFVSRERQINYTSENLKSVRLGMKVSLSDFDALMKAFDEAGSSPKIYFAMAKVDGYKIEFTEELSRKEARDEIVKRNQEESVFSTV